MTERKLRRPGTGGRLLLYCAIAWLSVAGLAIASEYHGQVTFGGLPLPGSTVKVTATQGDKTAVAITDSQGLYSFPDLADGTWTITVEMTGFTPIKQEVTVAPNAPAGAFAMKLLTLEQMRAAAKPVKVEAAPVVSASTAAGASTAAAGTPAAAGTGTAAKKGAAAKTDTASAAAPAAAEAPVVAPEQDATSQQANDGILINGSVNNAATSQYSMSQAFGNMRNGGRFLYNGGLSLVLTNSAFNAEPYSLTGLPTANRSYNNFTFGGQIGGPLKLKHVIHYVPGSSFTVGYSRVQNSSLNTQSALVPTLAQRAGDLSGQAVFNPATGTQFTGNIPISSQAQALLNLYPLPLPSLAGNQQNNYQASLASDTHSDGFQININMPASHHDFLNGAFSIQSSRSSSTSLFKFHDSTDTLGMNSNVTWQHSFKSRMWLVTTYSFNRNRSLVTPNFANRVNIEGVVAGINGASTDPKYWGPPSLGFTQSSINGLSDATSSNIRGETNSLSVNWNWYHAGHTITAGGDFRRRENNYLTQSNPDGSLGFNGTATQQIVNGKGVAGTGSDFADFLLGIPDTSQIAYGNEDKYLRQSIYDLYISDDFRVNPELSVKWGVRWEYGAPITELQGRLVNLDIGPGFTAEQPVVGSSPVGVLSGQSYPSSMVRPDRSGIAPNVGIAWRPISGSSLLVRSGYQISNDTSVYQSTAQSMMQQHGTAQTPLSTSLSISGSPTCQLSMVSPFAVQTCSTTTTTPDSFAIDPNFRVGYIQIWLLQVQRDLPASMQMIATYTGNKGTRGVQEFFPNTAPSGGTDPYAAYPAGYLYRTSNGNSTHEEGSLMLRRRPRAGLAASATYTYAKSLDDDYSLGGGGGVGGGPGVAQNWLDLSSGQRGLSTFDQRQVLSANAQYTTGMGLGGKALMSGWKGLAYKEWTVSTTIKVASGLPATPTVPETMMGAAGSSGIIRANYVGGQVHLKSGGQFLNPAAFATPAAGQWGTARRDSITGPSQFSLNAAMSRTFRLSNQLNLYTELDATNVLNHVTYPGWNTTYTPNSTQFGKPLTPNPMRTMSITMRLRF